MTDAITAKLAEIRYQLKCNVEIIQRDYPDDKPAILPHEIVTLSGHVEDRLKELEALIASRPSAIIEEPMAVFWVSSKQMPNPVAGGYVAARAEPEGNFDTPLYASPQPHTGRAAPIVEEMAEALRKCLYTSTGNKIAAENVHVFERAAKALEAYRAFNVAITVESGA